MNQLSLNFDDGLRARSRTTDPASSREAAEKIASSGQLTRQCIVVLDALQRFPNSTSAELSEHAGLDRHMVARRLPDLERAGRVTKGEIRKCKSNGSKAVQWELTRHPVDDSDGRIRR